MTTRAIHKHSYASHIDRFAEFFCLRHKVAGWTIRLDPKTGTVGYLVTFRRLPSDVDMDMVLKRPWSDEVEDYSEYKRIRKLQRDGHKDSMEPRLRVSADGAGDELGDDSPDESGEYLEEQVAIRKKLDQWTWTGERRMMDGSSESLLDVSPGCRVEES